MVGLGRVELPTNDELSRPGMCGTRWTEIALRTTAERTERVETI